RLEMLYSPPVEAIPPRLIGKSHSLTLSNATSFGNALIAPSAHALFHPQSHASNRALDPDCRIPSKMDVFTSAITSAGARLLQRGQFAPPLCDQQLVRF